MKDTTAIALSTIARDLMLGIAPKPCTVIAQRAIAILKVLEDGEWHTANEIAEATEIGSKYARDLCRICQPEWGLLSHRRKGWQMLSQEQQGINKGACVL